MIYFDFDKSNKQEAAIDLEKILMFSINIKNETYIRSILTVIGSYYRRSVI
jgi:hypothetical protein